ncbi:hypothetical protein R3P38DRAFT_3210633 [Favolaschia claudopus]|uniref:Uncharacterized protein n=1 Tax=Favolaschia claudopus TaxID=2862362 RepID=A0AAW0AH57_9AGAR
MPTTRSNSLAISETCAVCGEPILETDEIEEIEEVTPSPSWTYVAMFAVQEGCSLIVFIVTAFCSLTVYFVTESPISAVVYAVLVILFLRALVAATRLGAL